MQLRATLAPTPTAAIAPAAQAGGGFVIAGTLAVASLVCYNDTIFRDDFDADGF